MAFDRSENSKPYLKRWPLARDPWGMTDHVPSGFQRRPRLLAEFESLGDNCELGFVQRFHGAEPSSLFRWASAPLHGVLRGLEDGWKDILSWDQLRPWAADMAWDEHYQCAFHGRIRCAPDRAGAMQFAHSGAELRQAWRADRDKIFHLRDKLLEDLSRSRRVYVAKANAGLSLDQCRALQSALHKYGAQRLLCVVPEQDSPATGVMLIEPGLKLATISSFASYHRVEMAAYGEWTALLQKASDTPWD